VQQLAPVNGADVSTEGRQRARAAVIAEMAAREWNPVDLARHARVHPDTVNDFLRGARWPKLRSQARIERALGWLPGIMQRFDTLDFDDDPAQRPAPVIVVRDERAAARAAMPSLTDDEFEVVWAALQGYYAGLRANGNGNGNNGQGSSEMRGLNGR
jgi:hypothetical protein